MSWKSVLSTDRKYQHIPFLFWSMSMKKDSLLTAKNKRKLEGYQSWKGHWNLQLKISKCPSRHSGSFSDQSWSPLLQQDPPPAPGLMETISKPFKFGTFLHGWELLQWIPWHNSKVPPNQLQTQPTHKWDPHHLLPGGSSAGLISSRKQWRQLLCYSHRI